MIHIRTHIIRSTKMKLKVQTHKMTQKMTNIDTQLQMLMTQITEGKRKEPICAGGSFHPPAVDANQGI